MTSLKRISLPSRPASAAFSPGNYHDSYWNLGSRSTLASAPGEPPDSDPIELTPIVALPAAEAEADPTQYPKPLKLVLLLLGISLAAFLVALDRTIIATAIPRITDDFDSPADVGWYGSEYLLTSCAFQPTYGRVFAQFDVRWSFVVTLALFELGSLICAVAPSSTVLIVGRAIAGLGCAGIFAACLVIIAMSVPLAKRPTYMAIVGAV